MNEGRVVQRGTRGLRDRPANEFVSEFINAQRSVRVYENRLPLFSLIASVTRSRRIRSSSAQRNSPNRTSLARSRKRSCERPASRPSTGREWAAPSFSGRRCAAGRSIVYPEYTGTIGEEILKTKERLSPEEMRAGAGKVRRRHDGRTRLQQHLCARDAASGSGTARHSDDQRSATASGA